MAIGEALKLNSTLTTLYLQRNSLGENGGVAIAEALSPTGLFGLTCRGSLKTGVAQLLSDNLIRTESNDLVGGSEDAQANTCVRLLPRAACSTCSFTAPPHHRLPGPSTLPFPVTPPEVTEFLSSFNFLSLNTLPPARQSITPSPSPTPDQQTPSPSIIRSSSPQPRPLNNWTTLRCFYLLCQLAFQDAIEHKRITDKKWTYNRVHHYCRKLLLHHNHRDSKASTSQALKLILQDPILKDQEWKDYTNKLPRKRQMALDVPNSKHWHKLKTNLSSISQKETSKSRPDQNLRSNANINTRWICSPCNPRNLDNSFLERWFHLVRREDPDTRKSDKRTQC